MPCCRLDLAAESVDDRDDDGVMSAEGSATRRPKPIAPLYITIGPPCAGKTSWIKRQVLQQTATSKHCITDISLDDQPGVYRALPTIYFMDPAASIQNNSAVHFGKSIKERIVAAEQVELRSVLGRLAGKLTRDQFASAIFAAAIPDAAASALTQVVEELLEASTAGVVTLPITVDLFCREAIFMRGGAVEESALERTQRLLIAAAVTTAISWGNTNTKPSDYNVALAMAAATHRPVHFVVYHDGEMPNGDSVDGYIFDLTADDFTDLVRRSVRRLLATGRYVPVNVIADMRDRTYDSIQRVVHAWRNHQSTPTSSNSPIPPRMSKLEFHQWLARMANFDMKEDRTVSAGYHHVAVGSKRSTIEKHAEADRQSSNETDRRSRPWDRAPGTVRGYSDRGRPSGNSFSNNSGAQHQQRRPYMTATLDPQSIGGQQLRASASRRCDDNRPPPQNNALLWQQQLPRRQRHRDHTPGGPHPVRQNPSNDDRSRGPWHVG